LACAVHALDATPIRPGDSVTILGAGSLGLMLTALASAAGGEVTVRDPHSERLELASRFGARATRLRDEPAEPADVVIEAVGRPEAWEEAVRIAAPGGTVNLFGGCARGSTFTIETARVHYEEVTILGTYHHAPRYIADALRMLATDAFPWHELVGPTVTLEELPEALQDRRHPKYSIAF